MMPLVQICERIRLDCQEIMVRRRPFPWLLIPGAEATCAESPVLRANHPRCADDQNFSSTLQVQTTETKQMAQDIYDNAKW